MQEYTTDNFLTVETGEVYQPIRLAYIVHDREELPDKLKQLGCMVKENSSPLWTWYWNKECDDLKFSGKDFHKYPEQPVRLGTLSVNDNYLYIYLPSFKRACIAVPFFHDLFSTSACRIHHVDFVNKIFKKGELIPKNYNELFIEEELTYARRKRVDIYKSIEKQCETTLSAAEALDLLSDVVKNEAKWDLPYFERYVFEFDKDNNFQVLSLAFYLFMRSRELVAIKQATGNPDYKFADAARETVEQSFGCNAADKNLSALFFRAQALLRGHMVHRSVNIFC